MLGNLQSCVGFNKSRFELLTTLVELKAVKILEYLDQSVITVLANMRSFKG